MGSVEKLKYCNEYKYLLIEEITTYKNATMIHYGKCSIIGKFLYYSDTDEYFLQSFPIIESR